MTLFTSIKTFPDGNVTQFQTHSATTNLDNELKINKLKCEHEQPASPCAKSKNQTLQALLNPLEPIILYNKPTDNNNTGAGARINR